METEKTKKLVTNLHDKTEYSIHIRNLKQTLNYELGLKKVYRVKKYFKKDFCKLMNNAIFGKAIENARKHRDIKLVTTERRRNYLLSELNYHAIKFFTENLSAIEMKKKKILMNKPVYLGLSILELSKILMYEFWYDYVKPKYFEKTKLCYMDTGSFFLLHTCK